MKNQGKTLEPLARKLRKASEGDAAADAKSRLRLLSDEVVRVVASYLPAVETPGVRPPAAMCFRCGGAEGQVRRLRTCGCARARTYCDGCHQLKQMLHNSHLEPCEASCQMPSSYVPSTTLLRFVRRAAGSSLSRRDRDMAALAFVKLRLLEAGREVSAERWRNVLGDDFRPAPRVSAWLRRFGHTEAAIRWIQPGGAKFAQWFQRASLTQRRTRRVPEDYATVQMAVWAANAGDRVLVAPGTYNEAVEVTKDVIIEPSSGRATIQSVEVRYGRDEPTVFLVNLDVYCPAFIRDRPACKVDGARLVMVGCHVRSASVSGVVAEDDWAQLRLVRCLLHDCGESGVFVRGAKCALDDCRFLRNKASGLSAHGRAEASAKGCHFLDNKENGVHASNATVTLRHCCANGNERRSTFCQHGGRVDVDRTCSLAASVGAYCIRSGKGANRTPRTEAQARAAAAILPPAAMAPPPPATAPPPGEPPRR